MEKEMSGAERRKMFISLLRESQTPLSGTLLGKATDVSRQVVVQDIALLRTEGYPIISTARGYFLNEPRLPIRRVKVWHTDEQVEEELTAIVDLGGTVLDVAVNHRIYGEVCAPLHIKNRRDVQRFMNDLIAGKSTPLLNVTSGYHFHRITAETEEILDEIEEALRGKNYLAALLPYEDVGEESDCFGDREKNL
ncbi:MAG: transcription repressor NadR [Roseburia sp.]